VSTVSRRTCSIIGVLVAVVATGPLGSFATRGPDRSPARSSTAVRHGPGGIVNVGAALAASLVTPEAVPSLPALPRVTIDTALPAPPARVVKVSGGADLQAALDAARPGDAIELLAGGAFVGNFTLPRKPDAQWIVIRSSAYARLPSPGSRISLAQADLMARIVSPNRQPAITTASGAHHYRFIGVEITTSSSVNVNLILLEAPGQSFLDLVPTDIILDRCYIHGTPTGNVRRGIALNGARLAVVDSHLSDFHERGADSQAIAGWNGPGPFKIVNNYLEGAGENVLFGGADPAITNLVPSDIEVRRNHIVKPLAWHAGDPSFAGTPWSVKNLFELKNARRVLVEGNIFEQNWVHAQNGFAILFTVRNQDGRSPWAVVEDVTFINNIVRHTAQGVNVLGQDDIRPSDHTKRILIKNNLFEDVGAPQWGGGGKLFQLLGGPADVVIDHNTAFQTGAIVMAEGAPSRGFVFRHNIALHNAYGILGTGTGVGNPTLERYFPNAVVTKNVFIGGAAVQYPGGNFFPASIVGVGFTDYPKGDYQLSTSSPYARAAGGVDPGADLKAIRTALGAIAQLSRSSGPP
jgi:hypothetical protein